MSRGWWGSRWATPPGTPRSRVSGSRSWCAHGVRSLSAVARPKITRRSKRLRGLPDAVRPHTTETVRGASWRHRRPLHVGRNTCLATLLRGDTPSRSTSHPRRDSADGLSRTSPARALDAATIPAGTQHGLSGGSADGRVPGQVSVRFGSRTGHPPVRRSSRTRLTWTGWSVGFGGHPQPRLQAPQLPIPATFVPDASTAVPGGRRGRVHRYNDGQDRAGSRMTSGMSRLVLAWYLS